MEAVAAAPPVFEAAPAAGRTPGPPPCTTTLPCLFRETDEATGSAAAAVRVGCAGGATPTATVTREESEASMPASHGLGAPAGVGEERSAAAAAGMAR